MKPKPFSSENHLTVPVAISVSSYGRTWVLRTRRMLGNDCETSTDLRRRRWSTTGMTEHDASNASRRSRSAEDPRVADGVAARLRPDAHSVRALADLDAVQQLPGGRGDGVVLGVVAPAEPEDPAIGRDPAHVR